VIRTADDAINNGKKKKRGRRKKPRQKQEIDTPYGKGVILTKRKRRGVETLHVKLNFGILYKPSPVKRRQVETPYGTGEVLSKRKIKGGITMLTVQLPFGKCHLPDPLDLKAKQTEAEEQPVEKKKRQRKRKKKKAAAEPEPEPKKGKRNRKAKKEEVVKTPEKKSKKGKKKAPRDPAKENQQGGGDSVIDAKFVKKFLLDNQRQRDRELALLQQFLQQ